MGFEDKSQDEKESICMHTYRTEEFEEDIEKIDKLDKDD